MESAESLKQKGNDAIGRRDFQLAASLYSKALSLEPENAACLSNRSYAYLMLKQIAKSVEDAQLCCKLKPEWAKARNRKSKYSKSFTPKDSIRSAMCIDELNSYGLSFSTKFRDFCDLEVR